MERLIILSTPGGRRGEAERIGDVDAEGFRYDESAETGGLGFVGSQELIKVLSKDYDGGWAERIFHLQAGDRLLANCQGVRTDAASCIHFEFTGPVVQDAAL